MVHAVTRRITRGADDGAVAIIVALFAVVLFGFAALVVDVGNGQNIRTQSQNAVDAAALAGVRALANGEDVPAVVEQYVGYSFQGIDWSNCDDPDHLNQTDSDDLTDRCISWESSAPDANGQVSYQVRVKFPPKRIPESLAGAFGGGSITVSPVAVAASGTTILPPCVPCDPPIGADLQPSGTPSPSPSPVFASPAPTTSPAAGPPPPPPSTACPSPGTYVGGADIDVTGSCALGPGLYVFDDSNFSIAGSLSTSHTTLIFEGTATLTVSGSSMLAATAASDPPVAGEIPGVAVLFDSGDTSTFNLGASFHIVGNLYALDATWATNAGDCSNGTCVVEDGALSVAHTDFANSVVPPVGNGEPSPSPAPAHLSK